MQKFKRGKYLEGYYCPKCGSEKSGRSILYDHESDLIIVTCRLCQYKHPELPADACTCKMEDGKGE